MAFQKKIDLGNGQYTIASYDDDGKMTGTNGQAQSAPAGWQGLENPNQGYAYKADKGLSTLGRMGRINDPYAGEVASSYKALNNFNYDANSDPLYKSYADQYAREGQSAQRQTLANTSALTGGRENSWGTAATAQVGQAYAQKTADMIPQLAQQAYSKLLQRYNIAQDASNTAYGRSSDAYNRQAGLVDTYNQLGQQDFNNNWTNQLNERNIKSLDQQYGQNEFMNNLDKQYAPQERQLNIDNAEQQKKLNHMSILKGEIDLENYPEIVRQQILSGQLSIEQAQKELKWYDQQAQASINTTNRTNTGGAKAKVPSATDIKKQLTYEFGNEYGEVDKDKLLEHLAFDGYSDEEQQNAVMAMGITKAEIESWRKRYNQSTQKLNNPTQKFNNPNVTIPYGF